MVKSLRIGVLVLLLFALGPAAARCPDADLNGDCIVDFEDLQALANQWLHPPDNDSDADLDGLNGVESRDFALMARTWYEQGVPLVINELLASNAGGARDPQSETDDWIEIYNAGGRALDVAGMYLTDDLNSPTKWQIPRGYSQLTRIASHGHLVIWADEDIGDNPNGLHADFQLSIGGEEIGLYMKIDNQIVFVDSVQFPEQQTDISYGRFPDGGKDWRFLSSPTSGWANSAAYEGFISDVQFSHDRGFYDSQIQVTIACETEGANIFYSTDGSEPGVPSGRGFTGTLYTGPIPINGTTTLRARAHKPGWKESEVETHTYIYIADVITQSPGGEAPGPGWPSPGTVNGQIINYGMDPDVVNNPAYKDLMDDALLAIPSISIVTDLGNLFHTVTGIYVHPGNDGKEWERPASVELINPDGSDGFGKNTGLRIRGGYSRSTNNPKHAFRLLFGSEYGGKLEFALFEDEGVDAFWNMDLRCSQNYSWSFDGSNQNTEVREVFSRDLQGQMGHYYTRSRAYHLYLNGQYWGLFQTQERSEASYAASYMGGDSEDYDVMKVDTSGYVMWPTDGNDVAYRRLYNAAMAGFSDNTAYYLAQGMNPDGTRNPSYERMLDVDDLIDYMIIDYYTGDRDGAGSRFVNRPNNTYCIYNRINPDGWKSLQHDNEHTLGVSSSETNMVVPFTNAGSQFQYFNPHWLHERLATQNADYRIRFADHVYKHFFNGGLLTPSVCQARINRRVAEIQLAIIAESARWGDSKQSSPFTKNEHWLPEINDLLNVYIPPRTNIVFDQLKSVGWYPNTSPPSLSKPGSNYANPFDLELAGSGGTIYYTDDGSDPRAPGGIVSASAKVYIGPIHIAISTAIKARARNSSEWSPLAEAVYAVGAVAESLRISELMYHPLEWGEPEDPNREFIELTNIGSEPINLNLVRFTNGIDFTFGDRELGPRQYVLVVRNEAAFLEHYQVSPELIAGEYTGRLDNAGERVELQDAVGQTILNFRYKDGWYDVTDGVGFTLTIRDPSDSVSYDFDSSLVSYWKLDDGSGTTAIDSIGGNDGTLHGDAAWTYGRINGALSLDGSGDYVSITSVPALASDNVTVQAWVLMSDSAGQYTNPIVMQHTSLREGYRLAVFEDKPLFSIIAKPRGITVQASSPDTITKNQWHHIAGTNDGSNLKIYVDGELKGSVSSAGYTGVEHDAYIGYDYAAGFSWDGRIDDVRICARALSGHELLATSNPTERWNDKSSWRPSAYMLGSPGWHDSGIAPNPGDIVINEVLAHSHDVAQDWIELYNTTDANINIGGWYLSDSPLNLMKYKIASGTKIRAHDYLVFYEQLNFGQWSSDPGRISPFALSENGDEVYLSSAQAGVLMGFRAIEEFGASETGVSFGRYYKKSTNSYNFVPMDQITPGWANGYPKIGPIVISEIMYHPDWPTGGSYTNDSYEYVELKNITAWPVKLYRDDKALPWKFTEGIDFTFPDFPQEVTIGPGDYVVVVRNVNAFAWRFPGVPAEKVFGPYEGKLDNAGESVEISMPGDIDQFGRRYYIRVDRVTYSDGSHHEDAPSGVDLWPKEADGAGMALNRVAPSLYGNDPNNWTAAAPSPGQ